MAQLTLKGHLLASAIQDESLEMPEDPLDRQAALVKGCGPWRDPSKWRGRRSGYIGNFVVVVPCGIFWSIKFHLSRPCDFFGSFVLQGNFWLHSWPRPGQDGDGREVVDARWDFVGYDLNSVPFNDSMRYYTAMHKIIIIIIIIIVIIIIIIIIIMIIIIIIIIAIATVII